MLVPLSYLFFAEKKQIRTSTAFAETVTLATRLKVNLVCLKTCSNFTRPWRSIMGEKKTVFSLIFIMATSALIVAGITITILYRTAFQEQQSRLVETAQSQARLIEAVARFDKKYNINYPGGAAAATLAQIIDAHEHYRGFGKTGEFTLSKKEAGNIVFLLSHRHFDLKQPKPVPLNSELAEPMRQALLGRSGTVIGLDYRGEVVMAAHEPVAELDMGIVAKIDLSEIRAPFLRAGSIAALFIILVVLAGASLFIRVTNPMTRQLERRTMELETLTDKMGQEIEERKQAEEALSWEARVNEVIAELSRALIHQESIENISSFVLEAAKDLTNSKLGYAGYIEPETGYLVCPTLTRDIWQECQVPQKEITFRKFHGLWGWVLKNRESLLTNTPREDPRSAGIPAGHLPIDSFLSVPAISGGQVDGQISVANSVRPYTEKDLNLIKRLADIYTIAVQHKRADDALRKAHDELERRVQIRTRELSEANARLRREITERKNTEAALRESEEKYSTLVEDALMGVYIVKDEKIEFANEKFAQIFGYSRSELSGMQSLTLVHPEDRALVEEIRSKRLQGEQTPAEYEIRGLKKDGETIWVVRSNTLINYKGGLAIAGNVADVTQRKEAEKALRESEKELKLLSKQLLSAEENERKRIARELHDGIGQALSAIKFSVENSLSALRNYSIDFDLKALKAIVPMTQKTIEDVRRIVKDLRPSILDDLGILATISWIIREFQTIYADIRIKKDITVEENEITASLKTVIFRILQEALNNIAKHSRADSVDLCLQKSEDKIYLIIADNGIGFDVEQTLFSKPAKRGFGLASMRERAELSEGTFDVKSAKGKGTTVSASWPL
jgi:PAS domain S-box-containing protein